MSLEACLPPALGIPRHPVSPPGVACPGPCDERVGSSSQGPFPRVVWALVPTFPAWGSRGPAEPAGGDARDSWEPRVREVLSSRLTWKLGVDPSDTAAISRMCCVSSGLQAGELPRGGDWGGGSPARPLLREGREAPWHSDQSWGFTGGAAAAPPADRKGVRDRVPCPHVASLTLHSSPAK